MKNIKYNNLFAMISALLIVILQFVNIRIESGAINVKFQLPISYGTSLLTLLESSLMFSIYLMLALFCIFLLRAKMRKPYIAEKVGRWHMWLMLPFVFSIFRIIEKGVYLYLYEGQFSLRYYWIDLIQVVVLWISYLLMVYVKHSFASTLSLLFVTLCFAAALLELARLVVPGYSLDYVVGLNVYISTFATAILFYITYIFVGLSIYSDQKAPLSANE
ncbi:MAG: hypothetical protein LBC96_05225 [Lachnospiraceae bacterium]|nr:hypothetical protein [Lachnospiraceae bacterium]